MAVKLPNLFYLFNIIKKETICQEFRLIQAQVYYSDQCTRKKRDIQIDSRINKIVKALTDDKIDIEQCLRRLLFIRLQQKV